MFLTNLDTLAAFRTFIRPENQSFEEKNEHTNILETASILETESQSDQVSQDFSSIISVKANLSKKISVNSQNRQRTAWHFLTLGIPLLIESLSFFFSSLVHRETLGLPLKVCFKSERLPLDEAVQLIKFQQFNRLSSTPLNAAAQNKSQQQMLRLINKREEAKNTGNSRKILKYTDKLNALAAVIKNNAHARTTRSDLNESDWAVVDTIDFELAQEYFQNLIGLFNTEWMSTSGLQKTLKTEFEVDYHEAVVAESLALSLAYIEGLDGRTILLPVFNEEEGKFHSVAYSIKHTTVGDALPCYILESHDPQITPWMIIRGSQPCIGVSPSNKEYRQGGFESILADALDPECISGNVINKALVSRPVIEKNGQCIQTESLSDIFRQWQHEGKVVNLSGHSLGGTIVNALAVEFHDQVKSAYAFSAAGVSHKTADRWNALNRQFPELRLDAKLVNFDYEGDIVPSGGRRLIGNHLAIETIHEGSNSIYECHLRSHLNNDFQIQKIDINKETHNLTRMFCERLRIVIGSCFHLLLWAFSKEYVPEWWRNRKVYAEAAELARAMRKIL